MEEFWYNFAVAFAMAPIVLGVLAWILAGLMKMLEDIQSLDVLDLWYSAMALVMLLGFAGIMTLLKKFLTMPTYLVII